MAAIFKSSLQNLSPLPTSLRVEPLAKPKTGLKFFVNTTKPKTKVLAVFGQILETKVSTLSLKPFVNTGPGVGFTKGLSLDLDLKSRHLSLNHAKSVVLVLGLKIKPTWKWA